MTTSMMMTPKPKLKPKMIKLAITGNMARANGTHTSKKANKIAARNPKAQMIKAPSFKLECLQRI